MKLPESAKIGYKTYEISEYARDDAEDEGHHGYARHHRGIIKIADSGSGAENANTLLHELLHGCCHVGEAGLEPDDEERVVTVVANQLITVMQNNPEVLRWILNNANK